MTRHSSRILQQKAENRPKHGLWYAKRSKLAVIVFMPRVRPRQLLPLPPDAQAAGSPMLWSKVQCGVLRVVAGKEVRLAQASAVDRLRLLWIFRNFSSLPIQVLSPRQRALIE